VQKSLLIVESPTKARTLKKYLGRDFNVAATVGHIKDLPLKKLGVVIEDGFKPEYQTIPGKEKVVRELKKAAATINEIYLAPDPDREGEAIAWHVAEVLKKKGRVFYRVLFHELTEKAIKAAIEAPEGLDRNKFEAQKARRILDRLVGYQISPLLWKKVQSGLSAGRVQSVAVRIICEREREIQTFVSKEYWRITAELEGESPPAFLAKLTKKDGKKCVIPDEDTARSIVDELKGVDFLVEKVVQKTQRRRPPAPFTTSKLQQEAIRKLGFSAKKTMVIAQQLYEGIELGPGEPVGLITYMRTDSTRISPEAVDEAREVIKLQFGSEYLPAKPNSFKNEKKVQDAHEAIRPTSVSLTPDEVAPYLSKDQLGLYRLIWQRFIACQMRAALIDQTSILISAGPYHLQATGSVVRFPGFTALYAESGKGEESAKLPLLSAGMKLTCHRLEPKQHFTQPPPRFSEASLVKELEENGIGRPSTYATILTNIQEKGYVELLKGYFRPTELGFIVNDLLVKNFPDIIDVEFTARMEDNLDRIEEGEASSVEVLREFYDHFRAELEWAVKDMPSTRGVGLNSYLKCPRCGRELTIKTGKNGPFLACSGFPQCRFTSNYKRNEKGEIQMIEPLPATTIDMSCPECGKPMVQKQGRYGPFLACSGYPECKYTSSLKNENGSLEPIGISCPQDGCDGELVTRKSRRGKTFYGCSRYPECTFATWYKPICQACPQCGATFLVEKNTKKQGTYYACITNGCGFKGYPED